MLWRTRYLTIDAILIQWDANKWWGILQFYSPNKYLIFEWLVKYLAINKKSRRKALHHYTVKILKKRFIGDIPIKPLANSLCTSVSQNKNTPKHLPSRFLSASSPCRFTDNCRHKITWLNCSPTTDNNDYTRTVKPLITPSIVCVLKYPIALSVIAIVTWPTT